MKNREAKFQFRRSGETVSKHFNNVLNVVIRLENVFFRKPEPIPETSTDSRWKWFKGCLGALDGTHIDVHVSEGDRARYRNRKGDITTNALAPCTPDMQFTYVLAGWEGSAADGRILRSAIIQENGLKVKKGNYYLVDAGYTNGEGFLAPFRGQRYHLNTWSSGRGPQKAEEYFNMKHSSARNVIEQCFGVLKKRWAILRSPSFYPIRTQNNIILACCLLHNFIRNELPYDPLELEEFEDTNNDEDDEDLRSEVERITTIGTSNE
uniref:protein ALP1-like n=1 Tax=Erigeron canadensis TaxID=72917 RepID=UPI001CB89126|nr:protein ALP1-like [Erigeron canadensis]